MFKVGVTWGEINVTWGCILFIYALKWERHIKAEKWAIRPVNATKREREI